MYSGSGGLVAKLCPTLTTPWTVAHQAPLSMEFSRQEYWIGQLSLLQGIHPGIEQCLLHCRQILYHLSHQASTRTIHVVELKSSSVLPTKGWYLPSTAAAAAAKLLQSCPILHNSMDCSPPGSSVHEDSPGKNTGVGCRFLLQGIFPT